MSTDKQIKKVGQKNPHIKICKNGPYVVSGWVPLAKLTISTDVEGYPASYIKGEEYPLNETYSLCRCGQSKSKPFCDGMHEKIRFDGTEIASRAPYLTRTRKIEGPDLKLTDAPDLCNHAGFCLRAGGIGNLTRSSDHTNAKRLAIEEAGNCTSGRLVVWDKAREKSIEPEFEPSITIIEEPHKGCSGALWVRGNVPIESSDGDFYEIRNRVALCRCGASSNKPFCDGTHIVIRFSDGDKSLENR